LGFDRAGWIPVLPEPEREFRIVFIDNRGTGQALARAGSAPTQGNVRPCR
jgi:hypothetical protein